MTDQEVNDQKDRGPQPQNIKRLLKKTEDLQSPTEKYEKEITILFTDLKGSTEYFDLKGDADGLLLIEKHNQLLFPVIQEGGW